MRVFDMIRIGSRKPPHVILRWVLRKLKSRRTAKFLPRWQQKLGSASIASALQADSFEQLLRDIESANPFPGLSSPQAIRNNLSEEQKRIVKKRAHQAMALEIDLLGSGPISIGPSIDWTRDYKSNTRWPMAPSHTLTVNEPDQPSDIKFPWELSRLQWLLPVAQSYVITQDENEAEFARRIVDDWMITNPVCTGPNWMCAMDVALRSISIIWIFHACKNSKTWRDTRFRERLVKNLVIHGKFIEGNLEYADVNGNHLTADLAGLTIIGIALGGRGIARPWVEKSWQLLCEEFRLQVPPDGVCREASAPYHRLVAELFAIPAVARQNVGLPVDDAYIQRLKFMARFIQAATGPDGQIPIWGDADDGRALPLGTQFLNDHRYMAEILISLVQTPASPKHDETLWWLGVGTSNETEVGDFESQAFKDAGVYILRHMNNHVFVDAGPVGMAGRGGHGHNDCLSFNASLNGQSLIVDPGAYVYTADMEARNYFRSTCAHNTPMVDDQEINRFVRPEYLWLLHDDAKPEIRHWSTTADIDLLVASHSGYQRLAEPVTPVRGIMLEHSSQRLFIADGFEGTGNHDVKVPYTFAPGCVVEQTGPGVWHITSDGKSFSMVASSPDDWEGKIGEGFYSPSYGIRQKTTSLTFSRTGSLKPLAIALMTTDRLPPDPVYWLKRVVSGRFPVPGFKT